jgi:DNA-binding response OmpR family regulator
MSDLPVALIIEDTEDLAFIFAEALTTAGYQTEILSDGKTALERLAQFVPHIIILDMHLPHVSGEKILAEIRSNDRLADTRVIIATADAARTIGAPSEQADLILTKPISFSQLRDLALRLHPDAS